MNAEKQIFDLLRNSPDVSAITSNIVGLRQMQAVKPPTVTYQRISTEYADTLCIDEKPASFAYMQIDCWAKDYETADKLFNAVAATLLSAGCEIIDRGDTQDPQTEYFCVSADYRIKEIK